MEIKLNEHAVGIILKELVRRAIKVIRNERLAFDVTEKKGYSGTMDDVFTSADTKAQAIYEHSIKECFPGMGLIGEEGLNIPSTLESGAYITVDPLDGTRAFVRKQSHGISTMIALVEGADVISAWIGDINTQEIFGYRPQDTSVYRITEFDISEDLSKIDRDIPLSEQCILMRNVGERENDLDEEVANIFLKKLVEGSSIGVWFARLWKGEVGGLHMEPGVETPWDSSPLIGISKKLGFVFMKPTYKGWEEYEPVLVKELSKRDHETIVIHKTQKESFISSVPNS
jgi:fructose-1,6-bisphosphatase/inositol monophosphatase family enzyme